MNSNMKINIAAVTILICLFASCKSNDQNKSNDQKENNVTVPEFQNKGHELVFKMVTKVGNYNKLVKKHDVTYTYTYSTPEGKINISTEKYIFAGEYSYGKYTKHGRTLPQLEGIIEQGYDGKEYWLKHNGVVSTDENHLKKVAFNRPTNFYWFCMMQKLLDPGLNYEYIGEKSINDNDYDIVKITFNSENKQPKDTYQLYLNKETYLVDQFLFTIADFGVMTPKLMQVEYEEIEGLLIPTKRQYKNSTWDADISDEPWITATWTDIKFNTGITENDFKKENNK